MRSLCVAAWLTVACGSPAAPPSITIAELDAALATNACQPVDANVPPTRARYGVIPGALLLTDYETYALTELPSDRTRPIVFYCTNPQCTASHEAARRALAAGYTSVKILPDGIAGWVKAGKRVTRI